MSAISPKKKGKGLTLSPSNPTPFYEASLISVAVPITVTIAIPVPPAAAIFPGSAQFGPLSLGLPAVVAMAIDGAPEIPLFLADTRVATMAPIIGPRRSGADKHQCNAQSNGRQLRLDPHVNLPGSDGSPLGGFTALQLPQ